MTFQCYVPRSLQHTAIGAVFVTLDGVRHLIPDHWLSRAELREKGRLLRLIYIFGTIEVAGQGLEVLFEDAAAGTGTTNGCAPSAPLGQQLGGPPSECRTQVHPKGVSLMQSPTRSGARVVELRRNTSWPSPGSARSGEELRTLSDFLTTLSPVPGEC
jgi:hypothetical protein